MKKKLLFLLTLLLCVLGTHATSTTTELSITTSRNGASYSGNTATFTKDQSLIGDWGETWNSGEIHILTMKFADALDVLSAIKSSGIIATGTNLTFNNVSLIKTDETGEDDLLYLNSGNNWQATDGVTTWYNYSGGTHTSGDVTLKSSGTNPGNAGLTGTNWVETFNEGEVHTFTIKLNEAPGNDHFVLLGGKKKYGSFDQADYKVTTVIGATDTEATLVLTEEYDGVYLFNTTSNNETLKIKYISRTISSASAAVTVPTISPASGEYTGSLAVTITPGEGNEKVVYTITGSDQDVENAEITAATTLDLTGTSDIVITAKGYVGENASDEVSNTYTYVVNVPTVSPASSTYDGELTVTITPGEGNEKVIYSITGSDQDVENAEITTATTLDLTGSANITVTATGYVGSTASTEVSNTYTYSNVLPSGTTVVWEGNQAFGNNWGENITIEQQRFADVEEGDYIFLYANHTDAVTDIGFRSNRNGWDEAPWYGFTADNGYTSGGNGAHGTMAVGDKYWWLKVGKEDGTIKANIYNGDHNTDIALDAPYYFKNYQTVIQGLNFTLTKVEIHKAKTVSESVDNEIAKYENVILNLTRSFNTGGWNTICLPFVPTAAQATEMFGDGYKLAAFTGAEGTTMKFSTITIANFEAGKPYLVKPTQSKKNEFTFFDVDITVRKATPVTFGDYTFVGVFTKKSFEKSEWPTTRFVGAGNKLMTPNSTGALNALRAYFQIADANAAPVLSIDGEDDEATGIRSIENGQLTIDNEYYDLSGRRVVKPTKGVYIINGKKVILK